MNPISKKIINKISQEDKTELKSEKVELAGKYDFLDFKKQYDSAFTDYRSDYRKGINAAKNATDTYNNILNKILQDANNLADEFGTKADEIGIDYRNSKQYQQFQEIKKIILSAISNSREKQREISKII
jgi:hypothetical protein